MRARPPGTCFKMCQKTRTQVFRCAICCALRHGCARLFWSRNLVDANAALPWPGGIRPLYRLASSQGFLVKSSTIGGGGRSLETFRARAGDSGHTNDSSR
jgi:hypothetical protein